ncbi:M24 family metallopeptidase [Candidatus Nitrosocosmicus arcticus]|uniref:Putative creatinase n=1 Tax=Candidatus Nitrosocosmicus arcticus TaxID=2035267 RepID=A0A557SSQ1_9ARCH|nr:aminopeptidase P family protein [Candidatus Nitrosocosmicus arcticus]TVP39639.1 putative creatinase [Candidatus Nitrosocosmicus arcticus]
MNQHNTRRQKLIRLINTQREKQENTNNMVMILDKPEDIFYFTGFWGEGILVIPETLSTKLIVPKLEYTRALRRSQDCDVISSERGKTLTDSLLNQLNENNVVFYNNNNYHIIKELGKKISKRNLVVDYNPVEKLREIKDAQEIDKIKKASNMIDRLFGVAINEIKVNRSEEEIQAILVYEAMKMGAKFPFYQFTSNPLIIASGSQASFPHAETSKRTIENDEFIVLDITLSYDHYVSDATRTFGIGRISNKMKSVYDIVKAAQENGIRRLSETDNFAVVDAACRDTIQKEGFGEYFIHSTGHGVGLEVHELPWIRPKITSRIQENMTITIEPGIYLENKFGVRIEDSLCIVKRKNAKIGQDFDALNFHSFDKELIIL